MPKQNQNGDEYDAIRTIVAALENFGSTEQQRVLRYVQEKLNLGVPAATQSHPPASEQAPATPISPPTPGGNSDIKS